MGTHLRLTSNSRSSRLRPAQSAAWPARYIAFVLLFIAGPLCAEILSSSTQMLRVRLGSNANGGVSTVEYDAGVPAEMGGLPGVAAAAQAISDTVITGGSGVYRVRLETDGNARNGLTEVDARFSYDSSSPMTCVTPATCGVEDISFTRISWNLRDNDTHTLVTQYDGSGDQTAQLQTDTDPASNGTDTRHRNYLQFVFDNAELLPAGTYEGTITLNGDGAFF